MGKLSAESRTGVGRRKRTDLCVGSICYCVCERERVGERRTKTNVWRKEENLKIHILIIY